MRSLALIYLKTVFIHMMIFLTKPTTTNIIVLLKMYLTCLVLIGSGITGNQSYCGSKNNNTPGNAMLKNEGYFWHPSWYETITKFLSLLRLYPTRHKFKTNILIRSKKVCALTAFTFTNNNTCSSVNIQ